MATVNGAHSDSVNQQFSIIGVLGNLGTADVSGTAPTLPIGVDEKGAMYTTSTAQTDGSQKTQIVDVNGNVVTITSIGHGVKVVTTAGTDVALATSTPCKRVTIQAQTDNTSAIAVGSSGVDATIATGTGVFLNPGDVFELDIDNLADIYIDSLVSGEGVRYSYFV